VVFEDLYWKVHAIHICISGRVAPDFGSSSGKSEIQPFFPNPAKSSSGKILSMFTVIVMFTYYITPKKSVLTIILNILMYEF